MENEHKKIEGSQKLKNIFIYSMLSPNSSVYQGNTVESSNNTDNSYSDYYYRNKKILSCYVNAVFPNADILDWAESYYPGYISVDFKSPAGISRERERKKCVLNEIKEYLKNSNIEINDIVECYFSNSSIQNYIHYLNPKIKMYRFDHGASDIYLLKNKDNMLSKLKKFVKYKLELFSHDESIRQKFTVSPFAEESSQIFSNIKILPIKKTYLEAVVSSVKTNCMVGNKKISFDYQNSLLLLVPAFDDFTKELSQIETATKDMFEYIRSCLESFGETYTSVVLKYRDNVLQYDAKAIAAKIFNNKDIFNCTEKFDLNYCAEILVMSNKFAIVLGVLSSAQMNIKKYFPETKSYSIHRYYMDYTLKKYGKTYPEYFEMEDFFYKENLSIFNNVLPVIL